VRTNYTEMELDALREVANVGAGTAATSLSLLLGTPIDVMVPSASALPIAAAIDATGAAGQSVTGVAIAIDGDLRATALMLFAENDAAMLCRLLGLPPGSEYAASALGEVVNILCASYLGALAEMTGLTLAIGPPKQVVERLDALTGAILAMTATTGGGEVALLLDSTLIIENLACSLSFLLIPSAAGVEDMLNHLGLGRS
jgi:chemotaxis protein CheC